MRPEAFKALLLASVLADVEPFEPTPAGRCSAYFGPGNFAGGGGGGGGAVEGSVKATLPSPSPAVAQGAATDSNSLGTAVSIVVPAGMTKCSIDATVRNVAGTAMATGGDLVVNAHTLVGIPAMYGTVVPGQTITVTPQWQNPLTGTAKNPGQQVCDYVFTFQP